MKQSCTKEVTRNTQHFMEESKRLQMKFFLNSESECLELNLFSNQGIALTIQEENDGRILSFYMYLPPTSVVMTTNLPTHRQRWRIDRRIYRNNLLEQGRHGP